MTQTLEKFPIGPDLVAGDHVPEPRADRLSDMAAGLLLGRKIGSSALDGMAVEIAPHSGYRQYFVQDAKPSDFLRLLEDEEQGAANFPSVRYARGWARAEHAMMDELIPFEERLQAVNDAAANWQLARDLITKTYETYPGYFMMWPCSKWRYQLAIDCVPSVLAIADQRDRKADEFDQSLLDQSRTNVRDTLGILVRMYDWTEAQTRLSDADIPRLLGRKGAIIGVALEGAAAELVQRAAGNKQAVISPSLRLDLSGSAGADVSAYAANNWIHTAQVKKRVNARARKKYTETNLLCGTHHLSFPGEPVINTLRAIAEGTRQDELDEIGRIALRTIRGSRKYGCSPHNHPTKTQRRMAA